MIPVDRITARAAAVLRLQEYPDYDVRDALSALSLIVIDTVMDVGGPTASLDITTVAAQSEYEVAEGVIHIETIQWPTDWEYPPIYVPQQQITALRLDIDAHSIEYDSRQPQWWSYYQKTTGKHALMLERAASIAAGLVITLHYDLADGAELTSGTNLAMPVTQLPMLIAGTTWKLAEQFVPQRSKEFQAQYEMLKARWSQRMNLPTSEQATRPVNPF